MYNYPELFELGIHPNFLAGSTHGINPHDVMKHVMDIVPDAKVARTHSMFYSSQVSFYFVDFGIEVNSSYYLGGMKNVLPFATYHNKKCLIHLPYVWSEDGEMYKPNRSFRFDKDIVESAGVKVFGFHPIHIMLNSFDMNSYCLLKQGKSLCSLTKNQVMKFYNTGVGAGTFFKSFIKYSTGTMSEVVNRWVSK